MASPMVEADATGGARTRRRQNLLTSLISQATRVRFMFSEWENVRVLVRFAISATSGSRLADPLATKVAKPVDARAHIERTLRGYATSRSSDDLRARHPVGN